MSLREWLIIIGALVILGVLLDGVRRMIRARRDAREFSQGMGGSDLNSSPLDEDFNPELPNGGSRIIQPGVDSGEGPAESFRPPERPATVYKPTRPITDKATVARATSEPESDNFSSSDSRQWHGTEAVDSPEPMDSPEQEEDLESEAPHLEPSEPPYAPEPRRQPFQAIPEDGDDLSPEPGSDTQSSQWEPDPGFAEAQDPESLSLSADERPDSSSRDSAGSTVDDITQGAKTLWNKLRTKAQSVAQSPDRSVPEKGPVTGRKSREKPSGQGGSQAGRWAGMASAASVPESDNGAKAPLAGANRPPAEEVIVVNVHCKGDERLPGPALKKLFEGCGLEYGDLGIYHRHEEPDTHSPVQFSVANAVSPGTFRPEEMQDMATPGISFFLSLPGPGDSMQAFEFMLETAQTVVRNLGGELRDEQRSVMTGQTIEHCRQCIREFERRQHFVRS